MNKDETWLLKEKYGGTESDLSACKLSPAQAEAFRADCGRLAGGEPLAHVIGWVPFLDCKIWLSSDTDPTPPSPTSTNVSDRQSLPSGTVIKAKKFALIPRPETEFWTEHAISTIQSRVRGLTPYSEKSEPIHILDLCAGSGAIGVAVAKAIPEANVTFSEIESNHLTTISHNICLNLSNTTPTSSTRKDLVLENPTENYEVLLADLFQPIATSTRKGLVLDAFDFILCNPPYVDPAVDRVELSVSAFEPHSALYGGANGLEVITKIIAGSPTHLNSNGQLWLEHEPEQAAAIQLLGTQHGFTTTTHTDQYGVARYSVLVLE